MQSPRSWSSVSGEDRARAVRAPSEKPRPYDTINRPYTVTHSDSTPTVTYTYDQMGFVTNLAKTIGGVNFSTSSTYNYEGQPVTTTLPNTTTLSYGYDRMARLTQVTSDWVDDNQPATLANNFVYHASGAFTSVDHQVSTSLVFRTPLGEYLT